MDLKGKTLDAWLIRSRSAQFPRYGSVNYGGRYQSVAEYLNNNVHPLVTTAANAIDGGFLTDHGPDHIKTVILRASQLVAATDCNLTPYEVYLLISAIHLHDVGNLFGRNTHEVNSETVMAELGALLGDDRPEHTAIFRIAAAHGGHVGGNKDKISLLPESEAVLGFPVRERLLAALLRFADELADERARAAGFLLRLSQIHPAAQVYHKYAYALHSVMVNVEGKCIDLHFEMTEEDARARFPKSNASTYLLDEIYERTIKMHRERLYCMRFMRQYVAIDRINVVVTIYGRGYQTELATIPYRMEETGYPEPAVGGIHSLCPTLNALPYGNPLSGATLHAFLNSALPEPG